MQDNMSLQQGKIIPEHTNIKNRSLKDIMEEVVMSHGENVKEGFLQENDESKENKKRNRSTVKAARRTRFELLHDMLEFMNDIPVTVTDIKNSLKITAAVTQSYVDFSVINELVEDDWGTYTITDKGRNVRQKLEELFELIDMKSFNC